MRTTTLRLLFALTTFLFVTQWSKPAMADVTITGTVGEIGVMAPIAVPGTNRTASPIRFKLTDPNQTKTCAQVNAPNVGAAYAWFWGQGQNNQLNPPGPFVEDLSFREWYTALLVSKKGATIICTITDAVGCHVTSCTLP